MADAATIQRQMFDVVQTRDWEGLRSLLHDDYVYRGPDGIEQKGAEAALEVAQTYLTAFSDMAFEVVAQTASGDTAVLEIIGRGTHDGELQGIPPTGRRVEVHGCNVIELRDGKIWREREYINLLSLMQQLGVIDE
jgi:steroid delta-isomerase-like uncharacterized protein